MSIANATVRGVGGVEDMRPGNPVDLGIVNNTHGFWYMLPTCFVDV